MTRASRRPATAGVRAIAGLTLMILLSAAPLSAARPSRGAGASLPSSAEFLNRYADAFAACLARSNPHLAQIMLAEPYLSPRQERFAFEIADVGCLGPHTSEFRVRSARLVGRIAQFLIHQRYADADVTRFAGLSDDAASQLGLIPRNNAEDMALCVVRRDPQSVRALLDTGWDSAEEAEIMRRIVPHLGPCAAAGETLDLNAAAVRLMLATGLYRALAIASPVTHAR